MNTKNEAIVTLTLNINRVSH